MAFKMNGWSGFVNSPVKQRTDTTKVDPDAPGTPGKPGYEPPVEYKDLDEKGKKLWHKVRGTKYTPEKKEPTVTSHEGKHPLGKKPPLKQTVVGGSTKSDMAKDIKNQQAKNDSTKFVKETGINKGKVPSLKSMSDASKHLSNERFDAMMKEIRKNQ